MDLLFKKPEVSLGLKLTLKEAVRLFTPVNLTILRMSLINLPYIKLLFNTPQAWAKTEQPPAHR